MNNLVNIDKARPNIAAGGKVNAIVPQTMDETYRLAKAISLSGMAPKGLDKPEAIMVAIMHGLEIGLTPLMALQRIAVINGRPTLWGDGAMALVRGSGLCDFVKEWVEGENDNKIAFCESKRRGELNSVKRSFSVIDAKKADLWNKSGPWKQYPDRMLQMRARAFTLRDLYADVLGGMYLREEIEDNNKANENLDNIHPVIDLNPPSPPPPPLQPRIIEQAKELVPEPLDQEAFLIDAEAQFSTASSLEIVEEIWSQFEPNIMELTKDNGQHLFGLYQKAQERFEP